MNSFYVAKLLINQGIYRPDCFVVDEVELRPPKSDYDDELKAIQQSISINKAVIDPAFNCRIGTIVHASDLKEAELLADEKFIQVLDILSSEHPISKIGLSSCGFIKDLENGELIPIKNNNFPPSMAFIVSHGEFPTYEFSQWVVKQNSDLSIRYLRSLHWTRNGKWEKNLQIKILFNWFAVEALFKESESDNVGPLILWFLGFPNGAKASNVSPSLIQNLQNNTSYKNWKGKIEASIEQMRKFRNDSVHNGFRSVDFSPSDIRLYSYLIMVGCSRCQGAVRSALVSGIKSASEFKEYISLIFEDNGNLINDIHNNILYSLKSNTYRATDDNIYGE
ncbi:MAG TPA: hypothetical protein PKJ37_10840 [Acidobacteriota bacterium]|nr:hypothetical protein [Acidobacteriota bacterium]HNT18372.1 hypothetical protein [Acidobacteriota bacterium]